MTWSTSTPAGSDSLANGDNIIRELKTDIQTALRGDDTEGVEAVFPGSDTANPVYRYRGLKGTTAARPTAGEYGLYHNTTLNTIQRDNGSAWQDVATLIPSGTAMVFYQASAPTGWTAVAVNDKFLRVVTAGGTGGTNGGTVAASTSLAHTHTIASESAHTHDLGNHTHTTPSHQHDLEHTNTTSNTSVTASIDSNASSGSYLGSVGHVAGSTIWSIKNRTENSGSGTSGTPSSNTSGAGSAHDHGAATGSQFAGAFAYSDVIVATKD